MALSRGSRWFLAFVALAVAMGAAALWWVDTNLLPTGVEAGQPVAYTVEPGQSVRSVGDELAELGVVRSSVRFRLAADDAGLARVMQPGDYELETGMSNEDVIAVLSTQPPPPPVVRFTVQEGLPVELTLERLAAQFDHSVEDFREVLDARREAGANGEGLLVLPDWVPEPGEVAEEFEAYEGLLFPETYEVLASASPRTILQRMVDQLDVAMSRIPAEHIEEANERGQSLYETLIIASLVERETRVNDERPIVAGVIANRLALPMRLQIDATVLYARGEWTDRVLIEDTEIDHPYNTYRIDGLPPTPIAGFGVASLQAAFAPEDVTFYYYVLDAACDGRHVFADTLAEHNVNVQRFRDAGGCR